jgi:hypothetical protein
MPRARRLPPPLRTAAFTTSTAHGFGVTRGRLRASDLAAPFHGVRVARERLTTLADRCAAYAAVMPDDQAFYGPTAAMLWGIPLPWGIEQEERLHVVRSNGGRAVRRAGVVGYRASSVETRTVHGLRVTSPTATWCTLSTMLGLDDLIAAGDRLLGLPAPLATAEEIADAIAAHGRRRGAELLRRAQRHLRPNVYSRRETFVRLLLLRAGLPEPEPNGQIVLTSGRSTRGDLVFRRYRVLVEYEGEQHLFDAAQWATDVDRLNDLAQDEWRVIRITKRTPRAEIVARTRRALRERGWPG